MFVRVAINPAWDPFGPDGAHEASGVRAGIGPALCIEIMEAHGGHVNLQDREGGCTVVACRLREAF